MLIRSTVIAGNPFVICANVLDASGSAIQQNEISGISASSYDMDANITTWTASGLEVSTCVYNDYQSDARSPYYNVAIPIDDTACPTRGNTYQVLVTITPIVGEPFKVEARIQAQ
jgi:hypothetical protein